VLPATVAEPDRAEPLFVAQFTVAVPEPVPLVGDTVSQEPFPVVAQVPPAHPDGEPVIVTACDPAKADGLADVGLIEKLVQVAAAC
jgi:hypothetical protein